MTYFKEGKMSVATIPMENHRIVCWKQVIVGREIYYDVTVDGTPVFRASSYNEGLLKYQEIGIQEGQFGIYEDGSARMPVYD